MVVVGRQGAGKTMLEAFAVPRLTGHAATLSHTDLLAKRRKSLIADFFLFPKKNKNAQRLETGSEQVHPVESINESWEPCSHRLQRCNDRCQTQLLPHILPRTLRTTLYERQTVRSRYRFETLTLLYTKSPGHPEATNCNAHDVALEQQRALTHRGERYPS